MRADGIMFGRRILSVMDDFRCLSAATCGRSDEDGHMGLIFVLQAMYKDAMASRMFFVMRRAPDPNQRLGVAVVASALLHALLVMSLPAYSIHGNVVTRPVHAPLSVHIETLLESPEATPIVIRNKKAPLHQKLDTPKPVATGTPAEIAPVLSQPGVSVSDTLYLRPLSARASSALLAAGEFQRSSDISEKPEAVAMRVPRYPSRAQEQKVSGWVIVMLLLDERGKVVDAAAVESSESFHDYETDVAAELRDSTFTPGKLDGRPVKTSMFATVRFDSRGLSGLESATHTAAPASVENGGTR
jgi:hypothetical protein